MAWWYAADAQPTGVRTAVDYQNANPLEVASVNEKNRNDLRATEKARACKLEAQREDLSGVTRREQSRFRSW
jgi:hypothetical protein